MADKYEEMARQMMADGASEEMIARFVAEEMKEASPPRQGRHGDRDVAGVEEDPRAYPQAAARQRVLP